MADVFAKKFRKISNAMQLLLIIPITNLCLNETVSGVLIIPLVNKLRKHKKKNNNLITSKHILR